MKYIGKDKTKDWNGINYWFSIKIARYRGATERGSDAIFSTTIYETTLFKIHPTPYTLYLIPYTLFTQPTSQQ